MMRGWPWIRLATACAKPPLLDDACAPGLVCAVAGTGELGFNGDALPATQTRLASPSAFYESPDGSIVIVDYSNMRVRRIGTDGAIETVVGNGFHAYSEEGHRRWRRRSRTRSMLLGGPMVTCACSRNTKDGLSAWMTAPESTALRAPASSQTRETTAAPSMRRWGTAAAWPSMKMAPCTSATTRLRIRRVDPNGTIRTVLGTGAAGLGGDGPGDGMALRFPDGSPWTGTPAAVRRRHVQPPVVALDTATGAARVIAGTGDAGRDGDGGSARDARSICQTASLQPPLAGSSSPTNETT